MPSNTIFQTLISLSLCFCFATYSFADNAEKAGNKILRYMERLPSKELNKYYRTEFRKWGYYGAIYAATGKGDTSYGYISGAATQAYARKTALSWCENALLVYEEKGPCKLYAEVVPSGKRQTYTIGNDTLSQLTTGVYERYLKSNKFTYKAYAYAETGASSWQGSDKNVKEAQKKALAACTARAREPGAVHTKHNKCRLAK